MPPAGAVWEDEREEWHAAVVDETEEGACSKVLCEQAERHDVLQPCPNGLRQDPDLLASAAQAARDSRFCCAP